MNHKINSKLTPDVSTNSARASRLLTNITLKATNWLRLGSEISSREKIALMQCVQMSSTNFSP